MTARVHGCDFCPAEDVLERRHALELGWIIIRSGFGHGGSLVWACPTCADAIRATLKVRLTTGEHDHGKR